MPPRVTSLLSLLLCGPGCGVPATGADDWRIDLEHLSRGELSAVAHVDEACLRRGYPDPTLNGVLPDQTPDRMTALYGVCGELWWSWTDFSTFPTEGSWSIDLPGQPALDLDLADMRAPRDAVWDGTLARDLGFSVTGVWPETDQVTAATYLVYDERNALMMPERCFRVDGEEAPPCGEAPLHGNTLGGTLYVRGGVSDDFEAPGFVDVTIAVQPASPDPDGFVNYAPLVLERRVYILR